VIKLTASANIGAVSRSVKLTVTSASGISTLVSVSQINRLYPNYNTSPIPADSTGMSSTAAQLVANIKLGWNIGNTLEAIGGETAWGNPMVTNDLIKFVKQSGFNAVRIPCSWNQYADQTTAKIQANWLSRVKQVVQYCVDNDMYAILNIHWDGGWLENNCTPDKKDSVNAKQRAFWEQIATYLRDFDQHLIFASANEPAVADATQMGVLLSYHQTFINAVRSTGGKNAYRVLDVQGPSTDITKTTQLFTTMPTDSVPNKVMVEVHWYSPYQFAIMTQDASWGNAFYYWGQGYHSTTDVLHNATSGNEESLIDMDFKAMNNTFVSKGIPVMIGEFDAVRRSFLTGDSLRLSLASRAYFFKYVVKQAAANGLVPFYWDAGNGVINRANNTVLDLQALDSMRVGAGIGN
jgi:aryl-phospho-beta-D-glucosidase BglC (GH1 family)